MEAMFDLATQPPAIDDAPAAVSLQTGPGRIEFRDVHFGYGDGRQLLQGVSCTVEPNTTLAIVGASGCGKSTILRLLFRFYDVSRGAVLVDGVDVRDVTLHSLRESLGVVPQVSHLAL